MLSETCALQAVLYPFVTVCIGLAIAVGARAMSQAMLLLFLVLMPMMFSSGGMTPPETMTPIMRRASRYELVGLVVLGSAAFELAAWRLNAARRS